eukprot:CAMPEP_0169184222 /NCGR_PEP_ID=MMETSP1016-20121227/1104_1 /TAXON_ID=342587 /ORGANISM="Karlodinium micrum, Strain CCMP2283" /LENGTH=78 /DNA_ID=CAMNT_0009259757 /DNA_START=357 /DNA_END=590 /DNA_ORIENTATION=+
MDFIYGEEKKKMKGKHAHEKKDITNWHHATACLTFVLIILHFLTAIQSYMYYNMKRQAALSENGQAGAQDRMEGFDVR